MKNLSSTGLRVDADGVWVLDQTALPHQETWLKANDLPTMIQIIRDLKVRGAPLIGVAAAVELAWLAKNGADAATCEKALWALREARPTAVNLMNAMDRMLPVLKAHGPNALVAEAEAIWSEDERLATGIAKAGNTLVHQGDRVLTHCNTGGLVTVGVGTALGVVIEAHRLGKNVHVYVDETRPLLQGGRLNTWELKKNQVPFTLICDNMAAFLMQKNKVDKVMVGADRIAINGDFANKVGTYGLAVLCRYHNVPFYVVAPRTTIDKNCLSGSEIPVEERKPEEVRGARGSFGQVEWAAAGSDVWNPAFDVTPAELVTGWVLDDGVFAAGDVKNGVLKN